MAFYYRYDYIFLIISFLAQHRLLRYNTYDISDLLQLSSVLDS